MPAPNSAKLVKLSIIGYTDAKFSSKAGNPYEVMLNPEKYTHTHSVNYNADQPPGSLGVNFKFEKIPPEKVSFELTLDATGALPNPISDLPANISALKEVVYNYNGSIHSPNYVKLSWGTMLFKAKLTNLTINYTMFKPDGTPLRAKVNLDFDGYLDGQVLAAAADNQSPDISHMVTIKAGDTLPSLCFKIYGDSSYYSDVAEANGIINFRKLIPGKKILFPPLTK